MRLSFSELVSKSTGVLSFSSSRNKDPFTPTISFSERNEDEDDDTVTASSNRSRAAASPLSVNGEYSRAIDTKSFEEIWNKLHQQQQLVSSSHETFDFQTIITRDIHQIFSNSVCSLFPSYFNIVICAIDLCLQLQSSIDQVRHLYQPLHYLIKELPITTQFTRNDCDNAFNIFLLFHDSNNPFSNSIPNGFHDLLSKLSHLRDELNDRLDQARGGCYYRLDNNYCNRDSSINIAVTSVMIAAHALTTIFLAPVLTFFPDNLREKQPNNISQLNAVSKGAFVLQNKIDTIDRLTNRLRETIENDRNLMGFILSRGKDLYSIQMVVEEMRTRERSLLQQLRYLEEHVCLCIISMNRIISQIRDDVLISQTHPQAPSSCFCL